MKEIINNIDLTTALGFAAGLLTAIAMLPQVIKTYKNKKAEEVSVLMLVVLISGICLWIWYGIAKQDLPIIITNCISLAINTIMAVLRHKYTG